MAKNLFPRLRSEQKELFYVLVDNEVGYTISLYKTTLIILNMS